MYFKNSKNATHSIFYHTIGVLCVCYIFTVRHKGAKNIYILFLQKSFNKNMY